MRAIVPVAGFGTRLRPHTYTVPKALMPVAGKPILGHILDELLEVGVDEVVLVVGHLGEKIEAYVRENHRVRAHFVRQEQPLGNGHAIYVAREFLGEEPVLIMLGDTIFRGDFRPMLRSPVSLIGVREVSDPRRFGVVEVDREGRVRRIVEKPEQPTTNLAITGVYFIHDTPLFRRCLERLIAEDRRVRGEYWLADALQLYVDAGAVVRTYPVEQWYDCGTPDALLSANRALLDILDPPVPRLEGALVHPPVAIARGAVIEESVVGPYVCVAEGARLVRSVVRDSIVNRNATVRNVVLEGSLIGEGAFLEGRATRVNLGDDSEIELGG
ncbi:MAG: sugar phosphate nucleotidyltransferase [Armatimonadota bacterium]|nr:sugar phosphate nucleotidyltransferase [Armatimonadota bacterium]MDW8156303.1 sugar phosphate nucleotidyltransferase [Armatimonadota bacterium]